MPTSGDVLGTAVVPGPPVPKARARVVRDEARQITRSFTPPRTKAYEQLIGFSYRGERLYAGSVSLVVSVREGTGRRGDLDNIIKSVGDALNGIAYRDDKQVEHIDATIERGCAEPSLTVTVVAR